jgi:putative tryptophan/tyrosine transport system substrate-binding protein
MNRRDFITLLGGAAVTWPLAARAQRIDRTMRRVGVLMPFAPDDPEARLRIAALEQGLRDLGWVDSRNLRIDYRWATDDSDRLRGEAAAVVAAAPRRDHCQ